MSYTVIGSVIPSQLATGIYVDDSESAKISKIYANGEIVNQLVTNDSSSQTINGVTFTNNGDGSWTVNGTATAITTKGVGRTFQRIDGHYYLICGCANGGSNSTYRLLEGYTYRWNDTGEGYIQFANSSGNSLLIIEIKSGITCNNLIFKPQFIDLTKEFQFDTPTALNDPRIQKILNQGYIEPNEGEYRGTNISEFSSEPYNLLDLNRSQGSMAGWNGGNTGVRPFEEDKYYVGLTSNNYINLTKVTNVSITQNSISMQTDSFGYGVALPVKVIGSAGYTLSFDSSQGFVYRIAWYDKDGNFIKENTNQNGIFTSPANAYWASIVFTPNVLNTLTTYTNICFHRTGTRTDYAPHTESQTLSFIYQGDGVGTAQNSMEITTDAYVFTKNVSSDDMGTLPWVKTSQNRFVISTYNDAKTGVNDQKANILCEKFTTTTANAVYLNEKQNIIGFSSSNSIVVYVDDTYYANTDENTFKANMSGIPLHFELATPQVISIPKKHLGIVDLGSLNWNRTTVGSTTHYAFYTTDLNGLFVLHSDSSDNFYCGKYLSRTANDINGYQREGIALWSAGQLRIFDLSKESLTNVQFKQAMQGQYLFYETVSEVADIETQIKIEVGGTLTSNSEVLPNALLKLKLKRTN